MLAAQQALGAYSETVPPLALREQPAVADF